MAEKERARATASGILLILTMVSVFISQNAGAMHWTETTDTDFLDGTFVGTEIHETGVDAYVQTIKDFSDWMQRFPSTNPGQRKSFGFTNDSHNGRLILFGGLNGSVVHNDTWQYNYGTAKWEMVCGDDTSACAPPRRFSPSMVYDNNSKVAVLYGGIAADFMTVLSDTWEFHVTSNTWVNWSTPGGPRGLASHSMVYDSIAERLVLVGRSATSMEIWVYDAVSHFWVQRTPSGGPSKRSGFALGYNYQAGHTRVVLYGGSELMEAFGDTWEYDLTSDSWTEVTPATSPSNRTGAAMTYMFRPYLHNLVLWGGSSWTTETWRYFWDSGEPHWAQVTTVNSPNPGRKDHGLAYDIVHDDLLMFGGSTQAGTTRNDTWSLTVGYRPTGTYVSSIFNSYDASTYWQYIFWNQTPGSVPPSTTIRLQINTSNTCNYSETPMWRGPDGSSATYYTIPGQAIGGGPSMCIRYKADLLTSTPWVAAKLEDVTIVFTTPPSLPWVVGYYPVGFGIPLDAPIYINFSKQMDTNNVFLSVMPNTSFDWPWIWYESDTKLKITHNSHPFQESRRYDLCVWGTDKSGYPLSPDGGKCWLFVTEGIAPYIVSTSPAHGETDVPLTASIVITFSEPMDAGSCWPYVTIDKGAVFDTHAWSNGDSILTMTHLVDLVQFTTYTVHVPIGDPARPCKDKSGILLTGGPTADPWSFTTVAISPYIASTDPMHLAVNVPVTKVLKVTFSKGMEIGSMRYVFMEYDGVSWSNSSIVLSPSWTSLRALQFAHSTNLAYCSPFQMQIWAVDTTGKALITNPVWPNPWRFQTTGPSGPCGPYIMQTAPKDGEQDVPTWKNATIAFHYDPFDTGGMEPSSFTFSVKDGYGNDLTSRFTPNWLGMGPGAVELLHPSFPFSRCQDYTVKVITARDKLGRSFIPGMAENPFSFRVDASICPPIILWTQPADGALSVPLTQTFIIKFSQPMDTSSFVMTLRPDLSPYNYSWSESDTNVSVTHMPFTPGAWYNVSVSSKDKSGNSVARGPVPNPWSFRADCLGCVPYIVETYPKHGQVDVPWDAPIWINFSEPMDTLSFQFSLVPSAGTLSYHWDYNDTSIRIDHSVPYVECDTYVARVVDATNKIGAHLVSGPVPNPWVFKARCVAPFIVRTDPPNGTVDVPLNAPIMVVFSEPMDPASLVAYTTPSVTLTPYWPNKTTVVLNHSVPFVLMTRYKVQVARARDLDGNDIVPGLVPNPWEFSTDGCGCVHGLQVHRMPPDAVLLTWIASPGATYYRVYHGNDRLAPWPWPLIANVTGTSVGFGGHLSDMQNHFYIVRGFFLMGETANSTMGALRHMQISPNVGKTNAFWFSLPYNTIYKKASHIAAELGYAKINIVAKWDPARQGSILYYYFHGNWRGDDFTIDAGDGLWLGVVNAFDWAINGTDSSKSTIFSFRATLRSNIYWFGLPYTSKYATASQIVLDIAGGIGPGNNTMIIKVGKWDFSRQASDVFEYRPSGWGGIDFTINPGDGIWIEIVSTFAWTPALITPEVL